MALDQEKDLLAQVEVIGDLTAWSHGLPYAPDLTLDPHSVADAALLLCKTLLGGKPDRGAGLLRDLGEMVAGQLAELRDGQRPTGGRA